MGAVVARGGCCDTDGGAVSHVAFTLVNRDTRPLPGRGWAIYYTALHAPIEGSVSRGFRIEDVAGSFQRLAPGPGFEGLAPGQSVEITYRTGLLTNNSFAPSGVYIVYDDAPDAGRPIAYTAVPFERAPQPGKDPRVVTAEAQFDLDAAVRAVPADALPPVLPTPVSVEKRAGRLVLGGLRGVVAGPELQGEAAVVADYLKPFFGGPASKAATAGPGERQHHLRVGLGRSVARNPVIAIMCADCYTFGNKVHT